MIDNKLTDNEIIKALEDKFQRVEYPWVDSSWCDVEISLLKNALDLINRQQAEFERLEKVQVDYAKAFIDEYAERLKSDITIAMSSGNVPFREIIDELTETMKNEYGLYTDFTDLIVEKAIKEFAERLKESKIDIDVSFGYGKEHYTEAVAVIEIDNLVKEMIGENK